MAGRPGPQRPCGCIAVSARGSFNFFKKMEICCCRSSIKAEFLRVGFRVLLGNLGRSYVMTGNNSNRTRAGESNRHSAHTER